MLEEVTGELDLHDFGGREPSWDEIKDLSQKIFEEQILGVDFEHMWELPDAECDMKRENQMLFNWDAVLYTLLALASNMGSIGLMKGLLWLWVPIFLACGKHKYATHLSSFL